VATVCALAALIKNRTPPAVNYPPSRNAVSAGRLGQLTLDVQGDIVAVVDADLDQVVLDLVVDSQLVGGGHVGAVANGLAEGVELISFRSAARSHPASLPKVGKSPEMEPCSRYCPSMGSSSVLGQRRQVAWALSEPSAVLLWQLGMAWSSVAAVVDASMGRRLVLSGFVLIGPVCVSFTGRWLRTAVAGVWAIGLVVVLGIPDGIWGTGLERLLIGVAVLVALGSTLALVVTVRACLGLMVTASLATGCGSPASSSGQRPAVSVPVTRPVSCRQQYEAFKRRPALGEARMRAAVNAVQAAEKSANAAAIRSAMTKLMPAARAATQDSPPQCTDPEGLYTEYVVAVYAAGRNARSAKGISGLLKAAAPLKDLKTMESRLAAEANRALANSK